MKGEKNMEPSYLKKEEMVRDMRSFPPDLTFERAIEMFRQELSFDEGIEEQDNALREQLFELLMER